MQVLGEEKFLSLAQDLGSRQLRPREQRCPVFEYGPGQKMVLEQKSFSFLGT